MHETKKLRDLYDKIEINIRSLKALGIESESFGNLLVPVVMEKIPSELRLIISRKFGSKETWDLDVPLNELKSELGTRERCNANNSNPRFTNIKEDSNSPFPHPHFMQAVKSVLCIVSFARKIKSISCSTISEPKARRTILRRSGRAYYTRLSVKGQVF